jgi:hypothetical protein
MVEVYRPEQRNVLGKLFGGLQQGLGAFNMGTQAYSGYQSMFGGGSAAGNAYGAGGGAGGMAPLGGAAATGAGGKYGLGINLGAQSGGAAAATEGTTAAGAPAVEASTATAAGSAGEGIASYAPYAAPVVAGYATKKDYEETGGQNVGPIGTSPRAAKAKFGAIESTLQAGRDVDAEKNRFARRLGLGLTDQTQGSDQMSAIERRMSSQQDAERSITEARDALKIANLPPDEARSIERKLEMARKKLYGGTRRGSNTSYS